MLEGAIVVVAVVVAALFVARSLRRTVVPERGACEHTDDCRVAGCCGCQTLTRREEASKEASSGAESRR
jgi:hypothetical protein